MDAGMPAALARRLTERAKMAYSLFRSCPRRLTASAARGCKNAGAQAYFAEGTAGSTPLVSAGEEADRAAARARLRRNQNGRPRSQGVRWRRTVPARPVGLVVELSAVGRPRRRSRQARCEKWRGGPLTSLFFLRSEGIRRARGLAVRRALPPPRPERAFSHAFFWASRAAEAEFTPGHLPSVSLPSAGRCWSAGPNRGA